MKKCTFLWVVVLMVVIMTVAVEAAELKVSNELLRGETSYIIRGEESGGWKSRLDFPLNVNLWALNYQKNFEIRDYFLQAEVTYKNNYFDSSAGTFRDRDWVYGFDDDVLVYGEAQNELDVDIIDVNITAPVAKLQEGKVSAKAGVLYEYFDMYGYDLIQESDYFPELNIEYEGRVIEYEVEYWIPYLGLNLEDRISELPLKYSIMVNYSPLVRVSDYDDHLLADKISEIEARGTAFNLGADLDYSLQEELSITGSVSYWNVEASGIQEQREYSGEIIDDDIDAEIFSDQLSLGLGVTYLF